MVMTKHNPTAYAEKLKRGGNCVATTNKDLPCPIHGDRLVDGKWYCHVHDPDGTMQKTLRGEIRTPDVEGQMKFDELKSDDELTALHTPPTETQGRIAGKRIKKWTSPEN